jgi:AcrR family transcriptional regulator
VRSGRAPLSEGAILDAALRIVRDEGLEAVTMRRIAGELGVAPASLYVHLSGRDELLMAMLDRVVGSVQLPEPDPRRWREQVHAQLAGLRAAFVAHPGLAHVALASPPADEGTLMAAETLLGVLRAGGIGAQEAAWAADMLPLIATASAIKGAGEDDAAGEEGDAFVALSPQRFPNITALSGELTRGRGEERLRFAVDVFLDGLAARSA